MKKTSLYDNPSGYGHGGLGYDQSLDTLPHRGRPTGEVPAWLPWVGLAGAGVLGAAGLRGLGKLFKRGPRTAGTAKAVSPTSAYEAEMLGRVNPKLERMATNAQEGMAAQQSRMAHEESLKPLMNPSVGGTYKTSSVLQRNGSVIIPALGRIARGA